MSVNDLKVNIVEARKIVKDINYLNQKLKYASSKERSLLISSINSSFVKLQLINRAIPDIIKGISAVKKLDNSSQVTLPKGVVNFKYRSLSSGESNLVALKKEDKSRFLKELSLSEVSLKKLNSSPEGVSSIKSSNLAIISNKIFGKISDKIMPGFSDLKKDLQDSNSRFLLSTYLSIALFVTVGLFLLSLVFLGGLFALKISVITYFWLPLIVLLFVPFGFYIMPSMNKSSVNKEIANELPFAVIYMSAIAGSNIEPTKIFKIISDSSEYKYVGVEMRKIISQVEVYGYDLVTALKNVANLSVNHRFSELLNGMATNISSGSSLKNYLEKKSESLLMDYKLERNRYNEVAATFMDVYISVLITAPLILVMLIVIMSLTNLKFGNLSTDSLLLLSIGLVGFVNVLFLVFLQIKQPKV